LVPPITTVLILIGTRPAASAARSPASTLSSASRRVISSNRCRSSESHDTVARSTPASASGAASVSNSMPFVVMEMSRSGPTPRNILTSVGSSVRIVGSPPVTLSERTPSRTNSASSLVISSNVSSSERGSHRRPSAGMQ
jgi:hypothetical protein